MIDHPGQSLEDDCDDDADHLLPHIHRQAAHRVRKLVMEKWRSVRKLFGFALLLLVNEACDEDELYSFDQTRPWPAFGRQGLVGSSGGYTSHGYTSHASPRACGARLGQIVKSV